MVLDLARLVTNPTAMAILDDDDDDDGGVAVCVDWRCVFPHCFRCG